MTPKLPWTTPRLVEIAPPTRETRIELAVEGAKARARRQGCPPSVVSLLGDNVRFLHALEEIAAHPCRRLALKKTRVGWDCERLGAPLCEACIAAEALRGGSQGEMR